MNLYYAMTVLVMSIKSSMEVNKFSSDFESMVLALAGT